MLETKLRVKEFTPCPVMGVPKTHDSAPAVPGAITKAEHVSSDA